MLQRRDAEHAIERLVRKLGGELPKASIHVLGAGVLRRQCPGISPSCPDRLTRGHPKVIGDPWLHSVPSPKVFRKSAVGTADLQNAVCSSELPSLFNPRAIVGLDAPLIVGVTWEGRQREARGFVPEQIRYARQARAGQCQHPDAGPSLKR